MTKKRDLEAVIKSVLRLIDEAKNLENKIEDFSQKKNLEFTPQISSTKSELKSYSDWSGKKFIHSKNKTKEYKLNKKIENTFKKEFSKWIQVNLKNS